MLLFCIRFTFPWLPRLKSEAVSVAVGETIACAECLVKVFIGVHLESKKVR